MTDDIDPALATPQQPEDWPYVFVARLNAGDLEGVAALYDADSRFVAPDGRVVAGRAAIRTVLAELIAARARLSCHVVQAVTAGDVAVLYTDFDGERLEPSGRPVPFTSRAIEVLRRDDDGGWRLIVGDPNGRGNPS